MSEEGSPPPEALPVPPTEIVRDDRHRMTVLSRRSFLWAGGVVAAAYGGWRWLNDQPQTTGVLGPLRRALAFNENVWRRAFDPNRRVPVYAASQRTDERINGDVGLADDFDPDSWMLKVEGVHGRSGPVKVSLDEIKAMPATEITTEFFCIEGWSLIQTFKGVSLREFAKKYPPATVSGNTPSIPDRIDDLVPYVYMETPATPSTVASDDDDDTKTPYYVGLDMPSAMHVQTLLCYEMNGQPLTPDHGAPLRLAIPVKYGVKNLKRIGTIRYQSDRPKDYWAEQGYDWYAGL